MLASGYPYEFVERWVIASRLTYGSDAGLQTLCLAKLPASRIRRGDLIRFVVWGECVDDGGAPRVMDYRFYIDPTAETLDNSMTDMGCFGIETGEGYLCEALAVCKSAIDYGMMSKSFIAAPGAPQDNASDGLVDAGSPGDDVLDIETFVKLVVIAPAGVAFRVNGGFFEIMRSPGTWNIVGGTGG